MTSDPRAAMIFFTLVTSNQIFNEIDVRFDRNLGQFFIRRLIRTNNFLKFRKVIEMS